MVAGQLEMHAVHGLWPKGFWLSQVLQLQLTLQCLQHCIKSNSQMPEIPWLAQDIEAAIVYVKAEPDYWHHFRWRDLAFLVEDAQHIQFQNSDPPVVFISDPWLGLLPGALILGAWKRRKRPELFFYSIGLSFILIFSIAKVSYRLICCHLWHH